MAVLTRPAAGRLTAPGRDDNSHEQAKQFTYFGDHVVLTKGPSLQHWYAVGNPLMVVFEGMYTSVEYK